LEHSSPREEGEGFRIRAMTKGVISKSGGNSTDRLPVRSKERGLGGVVVLEEQVWKYNRLGGENQTAKRTEGKGGASRTVVVPRFFDRQGFLNRTEGSQGYHNEGKLDKDFIWARRSLRRQAGKP